MQRSKFTVTLYWIVVCNFLLWTTLTASLLADDLLLKDEQQNKNDTTSENTTTTVTTPVVHDDVIAAETDDVINAQFQCFRGGKIISTSKVCDGVLDCEDFSDECFCFDEEKIHPICEQIILPTFHNQEDVTNCHVSQLRCHSNDTAMVTTCINQQQVCDHVVDCPLQDDEKYCPYNTTCRDSGKHAVACDGIVECDDFTDECGRECWKELQICNTISTTTTRFQCDNHTRANLQIEQICDGVVDCSLDGRDEQFCPNSTHYYCKCFYGKHGCGNNKTIFTTYDRRFDGNYDCYDANDECPPGIRSGQDSMIKDQGTRVIKWILGVVALVGNILVIYTTSLELFNDRWVQRLGRQAKCNRVLVLNLSVADLMMGLQLVIVSTSNEIHNMSYCKIKNEWLTSKLCLSLGILSQISTQQSVFILLMMTSYRLYGTLCPFQAEESTLLNKATLFVGIMWALSFTLAIVPQARVFTDYFTFIYWLPMPFWRSDHQKREQVEKFVKTLIAIQPENRSRVQDLSWSSMINYVENTQHIRPIHRAWKRNLPAIGLYNRRPICQLYLYPRTEEPAWQYVSLLILFDFLVVVFIVIAYVIIYRTSSRPSVRKSVRKRSRQWRKDNKKMQRRILFIVTTDVLCWMPICIGSLLVNCGVILPPEFFAYTTSLFLPINSVLNPIVYSSLFHRLVTIYRKYRRRRNDESWSSESSTSDVGIIMKIRRSLGHPRVVTSSPPMSSSSPQIHVNDSTTNFIQNSPKIRRTSSRWRKQRRVRDGFAPAVHWNISPLHQSRDDDDVTTTFIEPRDTAVVKYSGLRNEEE